jgi:hypothetical protein
MRTGSYELALRLGGALRTSWVVHGHFAEGGSWLEKVFEAPDASLDVLPPLVVAKTTAGVTAASETTTSPAAIELCRTSGIMSTRRNGVNLKVLGCGTRPASRLT